MFFAAPSAFRKGSSLINEVSNLGLTTGLKSCLDAGDANSYDGSSQTWADLSGGGYSVYRGTGSGSDGSDPTFNGVAGRQSASEYWTFDGTADYFTLNQANPAWVENLHKNNAIWGFACWLYVGASLPAAACVLFGDNASAASQTGVSAFIRSDGTLRVTITNSSGGAALTVTSAATVNLNSWNFLACELREGAGTGSLTVNATQLDVTSTYSSPSAGAATYTWTIGNDGSPDVGTAYIPSGYRLANIALWESSVPTKAQLLSLRSATAGKFA